VKLNFQAWGHWQSAGKTLLGQFFFSVLEFGVGIGDLSGVILQLSVRLLQRVGQLRVLVLQALQLFRIYLLQEQE